jgi:hypothetical protein
VRWFVGALVIMAPQKSPQNPPQDPHQELPEELPQDTPEDRPQSPCQDPFEELPQHPGPPHRCFQSKMGARRRVHGRRRTFTSYYGSEAKA